MMKLRSDERCGAAVKRQKRAGMYTRMARRSRTYGKNCQEKHNHKVVQEAFSTRNSGGDGDNVATNVQKASVWTNFLDLHTLCSHSGALWACCATAAQQNESTYAACFHEKLVGAKQLI